MRFEFDPLKAQKTNGNGAWPLRRRRCCLIGHGWSGKTGGTNMAKSGSARSAKSKGGFSSSRSRAASTRSASSRSEKRTSAKPERTASISKREARTTPIDWGKVDSTTEREIARHTREDGTRTPSRSQWRRMIEQGRIKFVAPEKVDVRAIRSKLKLSQAEFAERFGFTPAAVRQWEQGRRYPHGPARVLLTIIDREPDAVRRALSRHESR